MERWCLEGADECLATRGMVVDDQSRRLLAKAIAAAVQRASLTLARLAMGEVPATGFLPVQSAVVPFAASQQPSSFDRSCKGLGS
jgi:hypothetical protein